MKFCNLRNFLETGDSLVFNDTKVIPARLFGKRESGGVAEIFLTNRLSLDTWEVLARPGKKLKKHDFVYFEDEFSAEIIDSLDDGRKLVKFHYKGDFETLLDKYGHIPLPSYIKRSVDSVDKDRYQTVYAKSSGAVAAPTAGLHFTTELIDDLSKKGVSSSCVTLHVGIGTFRPVQVDDIREHKMHAEKVAISAKTAKILNAKPKNKRQVCVGTTCCRSLESSVNPQGLITEGNHETSIFIYPGYQFKYVDHLITNFHLPGSSLLMLVSAFAGYDLIMEAYQKAIKDKYRFFSYGDAMLIL